MATAKDNFLQGIGTLRLALQSQDLIDRGLHEGEHNEKARILRNGLSIIGFSLLEDFIKKRTGEVLKEVGVGTVIFNQLPEKLKEAATIKALKGIYERAQLLKKADDTSWMSFVQEESSFIGSTQGSPFELSKYSLGWDKSNLNGKDITSFLTTFNVSGGWSAIKNITDSLGLGIPDPCSSFTNAASRRHKAAHTISANSLYTDLESYVVEAVGIAVAYDFLISKSLKLILSNDAGFLSGTKVTSNCVKIRRLEKVNGKWKEYKTGQVRAVKVTDDYQTALSLCTSRAGTNNEVIVIKDSISIIKAWHI